MSSSRPQETAHRWWRCAINASADASGPGPLLDIGIGTCQALDQNADEIVRKRIRVTGIDIDWDYLAPGRRDVTQRALDDRVEVTLDFLSPSWAI